MCALFSPEILQAGEVKGLTTIILGPFRHGHNDLLLFFCRNLIPSNLVSACFEKTQTRYRQLTPSSNGDGKNSSNSSNSSIAEYERYLGVSSGTNVLGKHKIMVSIYTQLSTLPHRYCFSVAGCVRVCPCGTYYQERDKQKHRKRETDRQAGRQTETERNDENKKRTSWGKTSTQGS